jgi:hypothetical protein
MSEDFKSFLSLLAAFFAFDLLREIIKHIPNLVQPNHIASRMELLLSAMILILSGRWKICDSQTLSPQTV